MSPLRFMPCADFARLWLRLTSAPPCRADPILNAGVHNWDTTLGRQLWLGKILSISINAYLDTRRLWKPVSKGWSSIRSIRPR